MVMEPERAPPVLARTVNWTRPPPIPDDRDESITIHPALLVAVHVQGPVTIT